ncbi:MAG: hypothetical protein K0B05_11685, partial [Bacteroidales bacterium]|nr:hypothetical protein [Bacteroidales bacterium]
LDVLSARPTSVSVRAGVRTKRVRRSLSLSLSLFLLLRQGFPIRFAIGIPSLWSVTSRPAVAK